MPCKFITRPTKDIYQTYNFAIAEVSRYKVDFKGSVNGGTFSLILFGSEIAGSFSFNGDTVEWVFTKKPFMLPCQMIKNFIKQHI